ncbi:MAG: NAD(P)H-hydrate dehydratase [Halanaerobium sp.]|nr:NAD(P)H-hydrate dehydratase [Halanaerobium sp.]
MKVVTGEMMRELDRKAIEDTGIPGLILMEHAGYLSAELIYDYLQETGGISVTIITGKGNNGGDGLVAARHLAHQGCEVKVLLACSPEEIEGDAAVNLDIVLNMGLEVAIWEGLSPEERALFCLASDLLVDGLLGTGIKGNVRGKANDIIKFMNSLPQPVIALDLPSGIEASSGRVMGVAVQAEATLSFGLPKLGNVNQPGSDYNGRLHILDIGIPHQLIAEAPDEYRLLTGDSFTPEILHRTANTHKGDYGRCLVIAGSRGMAGAASLSSRAGLKAGTGLVYLAVPDSLYSQATWPAEVVLRPYTDRGQGFLTEDGAEEVAANLAEYDVVVMGPGLGCQKETRAAVNNLLDRAETPLILDADALNCLDGLARLEKRDQPTIITPHPGEMARLLARDVRWVQGHRIEAARQVAKSNGIWVILKGSRTVVAEPAGRININSSGNPGMATAGAGDVLTGLLGGFLASLPGLDINRKINLAVFLHGLAGDLASKRLGEISLQAGDIIEELPNAIMKIS